MKMTAYLIVGIIFILVSGMFSACQSKNQPIRKLTDASEQERATEQQKQPDNPYDGLRAMALAVTSDQLGLEQFGDKNKVYGIIMDWNLGEGIATVAAYGTGDASLYLSSGGGIIGGGQHQSVKQAVLSYIKLGQNFLNTATRTEETPLPGKNCVRFYFLTNNGTFYAQESMSNIESKHSDRLKLFEEANKVLTELRAVSSK